MEFGTWHDSYAVMSCANFLATRNEIWSKWIFCEIWLAMENLQWNLPQHLFKMKHLLFLKIPDQQTASSDQ